MVYIGGKANRTTGANPNSWLDVKRGYFAQPKEIPFESSLMVMRRDKEVFYRYVEIIRRYQLSLEGYPPQAKAEKIRSHRKTKRRFSQCCFIAPPRSVGTSSS